MCTAAVPAMQMRSLDQGWARLAGPTARGLIPRGTTTRRERAAGGGPAASRRIHHGVRFRGCLACDQLAIVKDDDFIRAACGGMKVARGGYLAELRRAMATPTPIRLSILTKFCR
ncbi:hypothetical protein GCM10011608_44440 [Micromonospora sonchi]|uniref:Uncharacterized protein n=1 Tax=Micromonospora sonchi TaxID=1763543 RepID=A0A917X0P2_9ACTN|nr:hypothetical protein GCM10011608_44440 [Micromonospora sonchi]